MLTDKEIKYIYSMTYFIPEKYRNDFNQELFIYILKLPKKKVDELRKEGKLFHYIYKMIQYQYVSNNSSFYKKYKLFDNHKQQLPKE